MLPILCLMTIKYNDAYKIYYCMDCQIWGEMENSYKTFLNTRKFTTVNLTGNNALDKIKIEKAEIDIRKLVNSKDSVSGIKFHFGKKSEYWAFVNVINIIKSEQKSYPEIYFFYKNDIWVTNPKIQKLNKIQAKYHTIRCGSGGQIQYVEDNKMHIIWEKIKVNYLETIEICKKYYLSIIAYILMLFFTFRRIINEKKGIR